ncbi:dTDP-4-dehydrorhamnose 3,5-epimerase [Solibacillus sp. FSL R7-0668]|uniref:dTDP-4-dehydrorhamnose 3,5-epimerase n=1 Tax=Solibacillus sp. FSL R7-0668 TaxID=2921688 RepID=UPI0030F79859
MKKIKTTLQDTYIIEPTVFGDRRGFFMESYNKETFKKLGIDIEFVQDNHSLSETKGTLRGLHYQLEPKAQTKLVRCTRGAILDVIVDIRKGSPTFGKWEAFELTAENKKQLLVPKGFLHGFYTLEENSEVQYKVDEYYSAECDRSVKWDDSTLNIDWQISAIPVLSKKDEDAVSFAKMENNFDYGEAK